MKINLVRSLVVIAPLASLISLSAFAAKSLVGGPRFYYSVAQASTPDHGYQIPECAKMSESEFKKIKRQCETLSENAKKCSTEKTATVKPGAAQPAASDATPNPKVMKEAQKVDDTTKTYKLDYIVFVSETECKEAREHELEGE